MTYIAAAGFTAVAIVAAACAGCSNLFRNPSSQSSSRSSTPDSLGSTETQLMDRSLEKKLAIEPQPHLSPPVFIQPTPLGKRNIVPLPGGLSLDVGLKICSCPSVDNAHRRQLTAQVIDDIKTKYPNKSTPLTLVFHCSGKLEYELQVIETLAKEGYTNISANFIDLEYQAQVAKTIDAKVPDSHFKGLVSEELFEEISRATCHSLRAGITVIEDVPSKLDKHHWAGAKTNELAFNSYRGCLLRHQFSHIIQNALKKIVAVEKAHPGLEVKARFERTLDKVSDTLENPVFLVVDPAGNNQTKNKEAIDQLKGKINASSDRAPIAYALYHTNKLEKLVKAPL